MDNKNNYFTKVKFLISGQLRKKSFFLLFLMGLSLLVELFGLGIIGIIVSGIFYLVFPIINALRASNNQPPNYPLSIQFLK